jgi:EAL domain-containing protein (putative c-di-GMP-specific phosphodiesterase class I)
MGVVAPAYFIPAANDPYLHALSRFVIARRFEAVCQRQSCAHLIPLPLLALEDMQFIDGMLERLSEKARQNGFLIGVDCIDLVNDYALVQRIGAQLAQRNIGIAISDIDAEGAALAACRDLPVVEMKINRRLIRGCATGSSRCNARKSLGLRGAPALKGVETQSDFLAVRELGFDLIQGQMFAKPMAPRKFERTMLAQNYAAVA